MITNRFRVGMMASKSRLQFIGYWTRNDFFGFRKSADKNDIRSAFKSNFWWYQNVVQHAIITEAYDGYKDQ